MMRNFSKTALDKPIRVDSSGPVDIHVEVKPYNLKELCSLYKMSYKTMRASLKPLKDLLGKKSGYFFNIRQVEIIFNELGIPYSINENY